MAACHRRCRQWPLRPAFPMQPTTTVMMRGGIGAREPSSYSLLRPALTFKKAPLPRSGTTMAATGIKESLEPSASDKTHITCVETRRSSGSAIPRRNSNRPVPRREEGEERYPGVSTELVLYEDPWKIKKKLKPSDLGHLSRLLLPRDAVRIHVLQWMGEETVRRVKSQEGMEVAVRDVDTGNEHRLVFRHWASSNSHLGDWNRRFVRRRGLGKNDEIGMLWDTNACVFHFTVLRRAACGASNEA